MLSRILKISTDQVVVHMLSGCLLIGYFHDSAMDKAKGLIFYCSTHPKMCLFTTTVFTLHAPCIYFCPLLCPFLYQICFCL